MKERLTVSYNKKPCYNILLTNGFAELTEELKEGYQEAKICIVTDTNVEPLYAEQVKEALISCFKLVEIFVLPAGEEHKTLEEIQKL